MEIKHSDTLKFEGLAHIYNFLQSGSGGSGGGMNYSNFGSYGNGTGASNSGGLLSPGGPSSGGRMTGGSAFDFGANRPDQQQQQQQQQPNAFGRTNGMPGPVGSSSSNRPSASGNGGIKRCEISYEIRVSYCIT